MRRATIMAAAALAALALTAGTAAAESEHDRPNFGFGFGFAEYGMSGAGDLDFFILGGRLFAFYRLGPVGLVGEATLGRMRQAPPVDDPDAEGVHVRTNRTALGLRWEVGAMTPRSAPLSAVLALEVGAGRQHTIYDHGRATVTRPDVHLGVIGRFEIHGKTKSVGVEIEGRGIVARAPDQVYYKERAVLARGAGGGDERRRINDIGAMMLMSITLHR